MNKMLSKTVNKAPLLSILMGVIVVISIVLTAIFGISYGATLRSANTLTVTVNQSFYNQKLNEVKDVCESEFEKQGLKVEYMQSSLLGTDGEIIYYFQAGKQTKTLVETAKAKLTTTFAEKTNETTGAWKDSLVEISVTTATDTLQVQLPVARLILSGCAILLSAVLVFGYVSLRKGLTTGLTAGISTFVGGTVSGAVIFLTRLPVTNSTLYVFGLATLLTAVLSTLSLNKIREVRLEKGEQTTEEDVVNATATKEVGIFTAVTAIALILIGAIATWITRWFSIGALIGLLISAFVAVVYAPALYVTLQKLADKRALANAQFGKQRAEKQAKKSARKNAENVVEVTQEDNQ